MRPLEDLERVRAELATGASAAEVARRTLIPWRTIRKWELAGIDALIERRRVSSCATRGCSLVAATEAVADSYAYLLGQYLGDGSLASCPRGVYRLEVASDLKYPGIIDEVQQAMRVVVPTSRASCRNRVGCAIVSSYSKHWPCLFPQHGHGPKHLRKIALAPWQRQIVEARPQRFLRGLIHSDGCRVLNVVNGTPYPRYHFSNRSDDIRRLFTWACDLAGVESRPNNRWNISVARRESVALMDSFIGPKR